MISLNSFICQLKNTLPVGLDNISKVKYIYIQLGKVISFDPLYLFGTSKDRYRIYNNLLYEYDSLNNLFESGLLICRSIAYIYKYILNEFGIESYVHYESTDDNHVFNVILINNVKISADLQRDLEYIQTRSKLRHFNIINDDSYDQIEIDKKICYITNSDDYFESKIYEFQNSISKNLTLVGKVEKVLEFLYSENKTSTLKLSENIKFCKHVLKEIIDFRDLKKLYFSICYELYNSEKRYIPIISVHSKPSTIFAYFETNHKYDLVSETKLLDKLKSKDIFIQRGSIYMVKKQITSTTELKKI